MLFLKRLFQAPKYQAEARTVFRQIGERSRRPVFYTGYGVPDSLDGRFEMLALHAYALFHGLKGKGADADALGQAVYDTMFEELDGALRELGVADLGVGRRIKIMTEALNGRIQAYDAGFAAADATLDEAVKRNVFGTVTPTDTQVRLMTDYLRSIRAVFASASFTDIRDARVMARVPESPQLPKEDANATG